MNRFKWYVLGVITSITIPVLAVSTLGRLELDWPDVNDAGPSYVTTIQDSITKVSDNVNSRVWEYTAQADSTTIDLPHNYGINFADLSNLFYLGVGDSKALISYSTAGYTVIEKVGEEKNTLQITTPSSGGPHDFTFVLTWGGGGGSSGSPGGGSTPQTAEVAADVARGEALFGVDDGSGNLLVSPYPKDKVSVGNYVETAQTGYKDNWSTGPATGKKFFDSGDGWFARFYRYSSATTDLLYDVLSLSGTHPIDVSVNEISTENLMDSGTTDQSYWTYCQNDANDTIIFFSKDATVPTLLKMRVGTKGPGQDFTWGSWVNVGSYGTDVKALSCTYNPVEGNYVFYNYYSGGGFNYNFNAGVVSVAGLVPTLETTTIVYQTNIGAPNTVHTAFLPGIDRVLVSHMASSNSTYMHTCDVGASTISCGNLASWPEDFGHEIMVMDNDKMILLHPTTTSVYDISVEPISLISTETPPLTFSATRGAFKTSGTNIRYLGKRGKAFELDINPTTGALTWSGVIAADNNSYVLVQGPQIFDSATNQHASIGNFSSAPYTQTVLSYENKITFNKSTFVGVSNQAGSATDVIEFIPNSGIIGDLSQTGTVKADAYVDPLGLLTDTVIPGARVGYFLDDNKVKLEMETNIKLEQPGRVYKAHTALSVGMPVLLRKRDPAGLVDQGVYRATANNSSKLIQSSELYSNLYTSVRFAYDYIHDKLLGSHMGTSSYYLLEFADLPSGGFRLKDDEPIEWLATSSWWLPYTQDIVFDAYSGLVFFPFIASNGYPQVRSMAWVDDSSSYNLSDAHSIFSSSTAARWMDGAFDLSENVGLLVYSNTTSTYACAYRPDSITKEIATVGSCANASGGVDGEGLRVNLRRSAFSTDSDLLIHSVQSNGTNYYYSDCAVTSAGVGACSTNTYNILSAGAYGYTYNQYSSPWYGALMTTVSNSGSGTNWWGAVRVGNVTPLSADLVRNGSLWATYNDFQYPAIATSKISNTDVWMAGKYGTTISLVRASDSNANAEWTANPYEFSPSDDDNTNGGSSWWQPDDAYMTTDDRMVVTDVDKFWVFKVGLRRDVVFGWAASNAAAGENVQIVTLDDGYLTGLSGGTPGAVAYMNDVGGIGTRTYTLSTTWDTERDIGIWLDETTIKFFQGK